MPATRDACCYEYSYRKPREHYAEMLRCRHQWRLRNKSAGSILGKCGRVLHSVREYYRKGIAAANERIAANLPPLEVLALEHLADSGKTQEFDRLARTIDWSTQRPAHLARVMDLALSLDMITLAKELVWRGSVAFPDNKRIQHAVAVLSPHVAVKTQPAQTSHIDVSQQWLKEHGSEYKGQWVAVHNGMLLGVAPTLKQLHTQIGPEGKTAQTVIVKVLS